MDILKPLIDNTETPQANTEIIKPGNNLTVDPTMQESETPLYIAEFAQKRIVDKQKLENIRELLTAQNREAQIQSFVSELPSRGEHIDFSQLQRIGHGGTHEVFIYPQNPKFVIKLNRNALEKAMGLGQANLPPDIRQVADRYVTAENEKNEQLYIFLDIINAYVKLQWYRR